MLSALLYYLLIVPLSYLPFWVLYRLSDLTYFILYRLIGYRKAVVRNNLKGSFPEKSKAELRSIEARFYAHLCDLIVESIKAFSISEKAISRRMKHQNIELINAFYAQGKQVVMVGGHYGNWELYAISIGLELKYYPIALFTPLKNKFFNEKITGSRSKYGLAMLPITDIKRRLKEKSKELFAVIFAADQSPRKSQKAYWLQFLNRETGVQFGTEKFAVDYKAAVVFGNIYKIKRGHYEVRYELICENATQVPYGFITQQHTQKLEKIIREQPEYWLWSHKRWKHIRPEGAELHENLQ